MVLVRYINLLFKKFPPKCVFPKGLAISNIYLTNINTKGGFFLDNNNG